MSYPEGGAWRRSALGRVWIAGILIIMELALVLVVSVAWRAVAGGTVSDAEIAVISLVGFSALVGIFVLSVILLANMRAVRASRAGASLIPTRRLAVFGQLLAVVRLVVLVLAAGVLVAAEALTAAPALADACMLGVGVFDALLAVLLAVLTGRAVREAVSSGGRAP